MSEPSTPVLKPHDVAAEQAVLAVALSGAGLPDDLYGLCASDFFVDANRWTFDAVRTVHAAGEPVDVVTVNHALESAGKDVGMAYLAMLVGTAATVSIHAEAYASILREMTARRDVIAGAERAVQMARNLDASTLSGALAVRTAASEIFSHDGHNPNGRLRFTPAELCALPIPETRFAIPGRVPKGGLAALIGLWGDAKSLLTAQALLCFTRGLSIWGQPSTDIGNVLYLGHDMPQSMHQERFLDLCRGLQIDPPGREFILDISGLDIRSKQGALELRHMVEGEGTALLAVDSFAAYLNGDENSPAEVSSFTERLREIGQLTDCASLILHHPTKQEGGDLSTRARGSGAFMANIDACYWVVGKGPITDRERTLQTVKFRQANPLPPQAITLVNPPHGGLVVAFGGEREPVTSSLLWETVGAEFIRQLQHADTGMTREQLEADTRRGGMVFGRSTATKAMTALEREPRVRTRASFSGKVYSWTSE